MNTEITKKLFQQPLKTDVDLSMAKRKIAKEYGKCPTNIELLKAYRELVKNGKVRKNENLEKILQKNKMRTLSGVAVVAVLTAFGSVLSIANTRAASASTPKPRAKCRDWVPCGGSSTWTCNTPQGSATGFWVLLNPQSRKASGCQSPPRPKNSSRSVVNPWILSLQARKIVCSGWSKGQ